MLVRRGAWRELGNPYNYHEMTHHGEDPDKLKWFTKADIWYMEEWAYFLGKLKAVKHGRLTLVTADSFTAYMAALPAYQPGAAA